MHAIQEWINNHLIEWGIISSSANELDNTIVLLLIIAVTVGIDYACLYFSEYVQTACEENPQPMGRLDR